MKRKNLILSLVCSIILAIGLITFTVISLVDVHTGADNTDKNISDVTDITKPSDDLNEDRDGSVDKPYIINSAASLKEVLTKEYIDENGNYIDYEKVDDEGNFVYPELNAGLNYELAGDIDFASENFVTLFNKGIAFNGSIDGKDFAFKNITIEVTKDNLANFMYDEENNDLGYRAHIGLFGKLIGASIKNLKLSNITLKVDKTVLEYLKANDTTFVVDHGDELYEITVGLVAGLAFDSVIDVDVEGKIEVSLCVPSENEEVGCNALGGIVGSAVNSDISNSTTKVEMSLDGTRYFVGGLVGKAYDVKADNVKSDVKISAYCNNKTYIGGAFGLVQGLEISNAEILVDVVELGERKTDENVADMDTNKVDEKINIAGLVAYIDARDESKIVSIKNVKVDADIAIDGIYAGAFIDVVSNSDKSIKIVFIENMIISSNIDVLKAFGFARNILNTEIKTKLALGQVGNDYALTGNVRFVEDGLEFFAKYIDDRFTTLGDEGFNNLTVALGKSLKDALDANDRIIVKNLIKAGRVSEVEEKVQIIVSENNDVESDEVA